MRTSPRTLACGLSSLLTLLSAQVEASAAQSMVAPRKVALAISGPRGESQALMSSVGELLGRLGLTVVSSPVTEVVVASVTVQLGEVDCAVSIARSAGPVIQLRRVPRGSSSALTTEAVAHVIQSLVEELAEVDRAPAPPAADPPRSRSQGPEVVEPLAVAPLAPSPGAAEGVGLELGGWVSGRAVAEQALFVPGGGLVSAWRFHSWSRLELAAAISASYHGSFAASSPLVTTATQSVSLRLLAEARSPLGEAISLVAGLGGGADVFITSTGSELLAPSEYRAESVELAPIVTAALGVRGRVSPRVTLFASVSADLDLAPRRYVTLVQGSRALLFETWRVRPNLAVGFTFDLWGGP